MRRRGTWAGTWAAAILLALAGCSSTSEDLESSDSELNEGEVVQVGTVLRVTPAALNVREGPSTEFRIVGVLSRGQIVTCVETSGEDDWVKVKAENGLTGSSRARTAASASSSCGSSRRAGRM